MGDSIYHVTTPFLSLHINFSVSFYMQKFLMSFQQYCIIILCDFITVVFEKFISLVISIGFEANMIKKFMKPLSNKPSSKNSAAVIWLKYY